MEYKRTYNSILGEIILTSDGEYLTGLFLKKDPLMDEFENSESLPIFEETVNWLDIYFKGTCPNFIPKFKIKNATIFKQEVIDEMLKIPYGETTTYSEIAKKIASKRGITKMSNQAVGQAVGANPIPIIIPCHRVIGAHGNLTGYSGGGLKNKIALLKLEGHDLKSFTSDKKGNKL